MGERWWPPPFPFSFVFTGSEEELKRKRPFSSLPLLFFSLRLAPAVDLRREIESSSGLSSPFSLFPLHAPHSRSSSSRTRSRRCDGVLRIEERIR